MKAKAVKYSQVDGIEPDYAELRRQLKDYKSTYYGPHQCEGCGTMIIKQAIEQGARSWEVHTLTPDHFEPHHCSHIHLFNKLAGRILTVLDAALSTNPAQHKAVKDLIKKEFRPIIQRAKDLEGDRNCKSYDIFDSGHLKGE